MVICVEIKSYFEQLHKKLAQLSQQYAKGLLTKDVYEEELFSLQKESEILLEEWIKFEEALSQVSHSLSWAVFQTQHEHESDSFAITHQGEEPLYSLLWQRATAFYHLLMFEEAVPLFKQIVEHYPDYEPARLFLAHACLATNRLDEARYQLQFLLETTKHHDLYHLAAHGLACLKGTLKAYEQAHYYFEKINLPAVRREWQSTIVFNHAQTLFQLRWYKESLEKFHRYVQLQPDDWKGPYMMGQVYFQMGDEEAGLAYWFEALQIEESPELLRRMAKHFEGKKWYKMAIHCYELILKQNERCKDPQVLAGLAWNYGLVRDIKRSSLFYYRVLSLYPREVKLMISYAWMLLYWEEKEKAEQAIWRLTQLAPRHPLVQGLHQLHRGEYPQGIASRLKSTPRSVSSRLNKIYSKGVNDEAAVYKWSDCDSQ